MLRELTVNELKEYNAYDGDVEALLKETAERIEKGEKIIVKEKSTQAGTRINIYTYDDKLYRYIVSKSIVLSI